MSFSCQSSPHRRKVGGGVYRFTVPTKVTLPARSSVAPMTLKSPASVEFAAMDGEPPVIAGASPAAVTRVLAKATTPDWIVIVAGVGRCSWKRHRRLSAERRQPRDAAIFDPIDARTRGS